MVRWFREFGRDDSGASAIEYGLLVALMALVVIASLSALAGGMKVGLTKVGADMASPQNVTAG